MNLLRNEIDFYYKFNYDYYMHKYNKTFIYSIAIFKATHTVKLK